MEAKTLRHLLGLGQSLVNADNKFSLIKHVNFAISVKFSNFNNHSSTVGHDESFHLRAYKSLAVVIVY